jgi:D-alanyl-D-alanine carboxypeptidase
MAGGDVAGLQYLLVRNGEIVFEHCDGWADALARRAVVPTTSFNLYSITKPFTATLVLLLAHAGLLDLNQPIAAATGLPALRQLGSVRETLLHRAGFANPMPLSWFHLSAEDRCFDEAAFVQRVLLATDGRARLSARYSNPGYLALGLAASRVLASAFRHALKAWVLDPLRLAPDEQLDFAPAEPGNPARGHLQRHGMLGLALGLLVPRDRIVEARDRHWLLVRAHHVNGSAYGGLFGNARGLARFGDAALGRGQSLPVTVREQLLNRAPGPGPARSLGFFYGELAGQPWFGHAGGGLGGYGELRLYPGLHAVSVLLTNRAGLRDRRALDCIDGAWIHPGSAP